MTTDEKRIRTLIVDDSAEGGVPGVFNPFTTAQGTWECESRSSPIQADATALFFSLPGSVSGGQTIGRIDYEITSHAVSKSISGTIDLRFFPLTGNPLALLCRLRTRPSLSPACA